MVACEKDVSLLLDEVSLINNEDAEPEVVLPGGRRLRLEWQDDEPENRRHCADGRRSRGTVFRGHEFF